MMFHFVFKNDGTRVYKCLCRQMVALNFIEVFKITNYNIKHTRNTTIQYPNTFFSKTFFFEN